MAGVWHRAWHSRRFGVSVNLDDVGSGEAAARGETFTDDDHGALDGGEACEADSIGDADFGAMDRIPGQFDTLDQALSTATCELQ